MANISADAVGSGTIQTEFETFAGNLDILMKR
jgi:hypothetical protein